MQRQQFTVQINDDFDLDKILASGQCFRPVRRADGWYRFIRGDQLLYLYPQGKGEYAARCAAGAWETVWSSYFDLQRDYAALCRQVSALPGSNAFVRDALACGAGIRVLRQEPWEMLVSFLISQRKSIPAIRTAVESLTQRYGTPVQGDGETVFLFPSAQRLAAVPEQELAGCGLGYRTRYVKHAAQQAAAGELDLAALAKLPDDALFARLLELDGVGKKVANCVCLFGYGRTAMVPVDVWVQRLIAEEFGGRDPFAAYGQEAGIVQQYLFCYKRGQARAARGKA